MEGKKWEDAHCIPGILRLAVQRVLAQLSHRSGTGRLHLLPQFTRLWISLGGKNFWRRGRTVFAYLAAGGNRRGIGQVQWNKKTFP
jgi:hypothetical protein